MANFLVVMNEKYLDKQWLDLSITHADKDLSVIEYYNENSTTCKKMNKLMKHKDKC